MAHASGIIYRMHPANKKVPMFFARLRLREPNKHEGVYQSSAFSFKKIPEIRLPLWKYMVLAEHVN